MKKLFKNATILEISLIFLLSLTPLIWFKEGTIIVGHDNVFAIDPITFLQGRLFTWIDHGFGQSQNLIMGTIPIHLIDAIPYFLGFSLQVTEKTVYIFWFFLIGLSVYFLSKQFKEQSFYFRATAVLLYQYNFFLLQAWWIGERTKFSAFIAFPLIITVFLKVYRKELGIFEAVILNSLIFFVFNAGGLYGIPLYGGLFIAISTFILFFGIFSIIEKKYEIFRKLILTVAFSIIGYLVINSYFILPAALKIHNEYNYNIEKGGGTQGLLAWSKEISANASIINLLRLQGIAEWYDNLEHPYSSVFLKNPFFIALSFLWPLLIILSLTVNGEREKRKFILFFFLVFLAGIILSSGTHRPFGVVYEQLMEHVPGFAAFRSPYFKFASAMFFAASFLIAFFIDKFKGRTKYILFALLVIFVIGYHFPYFTGNFFSWKRGYSTRLQMPDYVVSFGEWLNKEKNDGKRVFFLPPNNPNLRYSTYDWGYLSFQFLPTLTSNRSTIINNDRLNDNESKLVDSLYDAFTREDIHSITQLAFHLGVGYFVIQEDTTSDESNAFFSVDYEKYKYVIEEKLRLPMVKRFGRWLLYKANEDPLPLSFAVDKQVLVSGQIRDFSSLYDFVNTNQVVLEKTDLQKVSTSISFTDVYSPYCLKCIKKDRPFIKYPERNILPNSPLYPLVLYNDMRSLSSDQKSLIYDYLGLTLKRLSEMKEMIAKDIDIPGNVLDTYEALSRLIQNSFNKLSKEEEKYEVAEVLRYYIQDQREVIVDDLGDDVRGGKPVIVLDHVLMSLIGIEASIKPYLFADDISNNRLYSVFLEQPDIYNFYIRSRDFISLPRENSTITITVDNQHIRKVSVSEESFESGWILVGSLNLSQGNHTILLNFTEPVNSLGKLTPSVTEFSVAGKSQCFSARMQDYKPMKNYRVVVNYSNELLSDLNLYIWEETKGKLQLRSANRLKRIFYKEEFSELIDHQDGTDGIVVGLCSVKITEDYFTQRFNIKISEFIEPNMLIDRGDYPLNAIQSVKTENINPTKYNISFTAQNPNTLLVWLSRFDIGWELKGFEKNHLPVNGFANGWVIDKPGNYKLTLEYRPQKIFLIGAFVSLTTAFGGTFYMLKTLISKKK